MRKWIEVAAGVIWRADGCFLLGRRHGSFYEGYWEFPGGKVEPGECAEQALVRELQEELGIRVTTLNPWLVCRHEYEHASVCLRFFQVTDWEGDVRDHVHDALSWQWPGALNVGPMLPANDFVLRALQLPRFMAITHAAQIGLQNQLSQAETALAGGLRLIQLREPGMRGAQLETFARSLLALTRLYGAKLLVNDDVALAARIGADGVHLKSRTLATLSRRPECEWAGASCHDASDIVRAAELGLDYAVLGAVKPTATHPGASALGWERFAALCKETPIPVYALGGLGPADMTRAHQAGAHGVAAIRQAWGGQARATA